MKKFLLLILVASFCVVGTYANASFDNPWAGSYTIEVTVTPPTPAADWKPTIPAHLNVGTTYSVDMHITYNEDPSDEDWAFFLLESTIAFNNSGNSYLAEGTAQNIVWDGIVPLSGEYDLDFNIAVTSEMINDTSATVSFRGTDFDHKRWDMNTTETLPVTVTPEPAVTGTPEPSTMLLLGFGLLGLVGVIRRKKKI